MERIEYYSDFRQFLKDYYKEKKRAFKNFSFRYFCQKAGIKSPSLFKEVVEGRRSLTAATIKSFIKGLELSELDGRYFEILVQFNQAKNAAEKQEYLETLRGLMRRAKVKLMPVDLYAYYSKWYYSALRELIVLHNWRDDFEALAAALNPPIGVREAKEGVRLLLDLGLVKKAPHGRYEQTDPAITTGPEVVSPAIRELNRQMATLGERAIRLLPPSQRDASSLMLGLSQKSYQIAKQEIQEFKRRLINLALEDAQSDTVYNLNVHLFPISRTGFKQEEKNANPQ